MQMRRLLFPRGARRSRPALSVLLCTAALTTTAHSVAAADRHPPASATSESDRGSFLLLGFGVGFSPNANVYVDNSMKAYEPSFGLSSSAVLNLRMGASLGRNQFILEGTLTRQSAEVFEANSFFSDNNILELWYRRMFHPFSGAPNLWLEPGLGAGVSFGDAEMSHEDSDDLTAVLVSDDAFTAALSFMIEYIHEGRWLGLGLEYRYRFGTSYDAVARNGGEAYFPGSPTLEFSGHEIILTMQGYIGRHPPKEEPE